VKKLVAAADLGAGALLVVVPRWVFPPCGGVGRPPMHCTTTAGVELALGVLLLAAGAVVLAARGRLLVRAGAWASCALLLAAGVAPSVYGYCASPKMACHYGMAPSVRFVAAVAGVMVVAAIALGRNAMGGEEPSG
jgi:Domain of unknown function (DUF4418)